MEAIIRKIKDFLGKLFNKMVFPSPFYDVPVLYFSSSFLWISWAIFGTVIGYFGEYFKIDK